MTKKLGSRAAVNPMAMMSELTAKSPDAELAIQEITTVPGFNPRRLLSDEAFSEDALGPLALSIRERGIIQPLVVRRKGNQIQLIAGERRLAAARLAGLKRVPVVFLEVDDRQAYEIAIIENAQRQDLDMVTETLVGFEYLSRHLEMSQDDVVTYLNAVRKGRRADDHNVEELLRMAYGTGVTTWSLRRAAILKMTPEEHAAIRRGDIDVKVCAELGRLKPDSPQRAELLQRAIDEHLSAEQVRALVQASRQQGGEGSALLASRVAAVRKDLPRLTRLKGQSAVKAERLISDLEKKLAELLTG